jgi:hypothetical protein
MSNTIQIKRSSTASSVPTAGQLAQGELAVNLADKKLYTKDNTNAVVLLNPETPPFSINGLTTTTVATDDFLPFADTSDSGNPKKATVQSVVALGLNATGNAPTYACRAWVNFNGTTTTPSIRASGNVSSITRIGTGFYRPNFATAMPDANYSVSGMCENTSSGKAVVTELRNLTTANFEFATSPGLGGAGLQDSGIITINVFR